VIILDTCVLLESIKPAPEPRVMSWIESLPEHRVYLAAITIGELEKGVRLLDPGAKAQALRIWLEQLLDRFQGRILPFDAKAATVWGRLSAQLQQSGGPAPVADCMLAALAGRHGALLATPNTADLSRCGVDLVNPWEG